MDSDMNHSVNLHQSIIESTFNSVLENPDLLLNGDVSDNFPNGFLDGTSEGEGVDTFESQGMNAFPITALLDIQDDENSLSDYISMATPVSVPSSSASDSPSPLSQSSTNFYSKIAAAAASSAFTNIPRSNSTSVGVNQSQKDGANVDSSGKKRKLEGHSAKGPQDKLAKLTEKQKLNRINFLNAKRRKIYVAICKKEVGKNQRNRTNTFKESLAMKKKLAHACARFVRKKAAQSQKCMKESVCKAKRLTQEMELHWKMVERAERDLTRKKEKEAEEKRKQEMEISNKKTRQRKLNRLVILVEMFASKLLKTDSAVGLNGFADEMDISLEGNSDRKKLIFDMQTSSDLAIKDHQNLIKLLDMSGLYPQDNSLADARTYNDEISQPQIFEGILNSPQVYGMSWLFKMYREGLNGILADEMGVGNRKQVIAFMSHLAESFGLWGPFLIVAPSGSLSEWQSDIQTMSPRFTVVPYWGKPVERRNRRQYWDNTNLHTNEACFHVVVTSYQVMASDLKHVSKVKWQYLIMDDSQGAITSSTKWMPLLSFRCRTKLLLSSSLRLNSLSHLSSYLYFVMPSLFDSQEELSEWLLKELESPTDSKKFQACDKTTEQLRSVVQRFVLDCSCKDLQKDMIPSIDIQLYCSPSKKQRQIYAHLLEGSGLHSILTDVDVCRPDEVRNRMKTVLNLSARLMKVCNHPDLIDSLNIKSPFWMECGTETLPKLIYEDRPFLSNSSEVMDRFFCIYSAHNVHSSLFSAESVRQGSSVTKTYEDKLQTWSFVRILNLSPQEVQYLYTKSSCSRLTYLVNFQSVLGLEKIHYETIWGGDLGRNNLVNVPIEFLYHFFSQSQVLSNLVYITKVPHKSYTWGEYSVSPIPTTVEYRSLRSKTTVSGLGKDLPEVKRRSSALQIPSFLHCYMEHVLSKGIQPSFVSGVGPKIQLLENRFLLSELRHEIRQEEIIHEQTIDLMTQAFTMHNWSFTKLPDPLHLIAESGKLQRLDGLLTNLHKSESRVLVCTFIEDTLEILEKFLQLRRWRYIVLEPGRQSDVGFNVDPFVYVINARDCSTIPTVSVDTVVFFDHDWNAKLDEQKQKVISKFEHPTQVNCYRLITKGTIEESLTKLAKEGNMASLIYRQDDLDNLNGLSIPSLKSLISVILSGNRKEGNQKKPCPSSRVAYTPRPKIQMNKSFNAGWTQSEPHTKDKRSDGAVYSDIDHIFDYVNGGREDSDSGSPSYSHSEGHDSNGMDMKDCQEDRFCFNLDKGYMGMIPDSYEEMAIKSDYEEDSSPKKYRLGRGSGKRGRPPSRSRFQKRDLAVGGSQMRRGPGRPRLKSVGPLNQGMRGRRPGRPPLAKKAETISSALTPLSSSQRVFGFYSSPDLELS